jgi:hypothetical protein
MKTITFNNVENIVFLDTKLRKLLSDDFGKTFNTWSLGQADHTLRPLAQKMLIQFVNKVDDKHIEIMKEYFNEDVKVEKINADIATHIKLPIHEAEQYLNSNAILKEAVFSYRDAEHVYLSFWR